MSAYRDLMPLVLWPMEEHYHPHHSLWPHNNPGSPYVHGGLSSAFRALERQMHLVEKDVNHLMGRAADHRLQPWSDSMLKDFPKSFEMTEAENGRKMNLKLDMKVFHPEDIKVTLKDKHLVVEAKREDHDGHGGRSFQHYYRHYALPEEVKTKTFKSVLTKDGFLKIEADCPPPLEDSKSAERKIAIQKEK